MSRGAAEDENENGQPSPTLQAEGVLRTTISGRCRIAKRWVGVTDQVVPKPNESHYVLGERALERVERVLVVGERPGNLAATA